MKEIIENIRCWFNEVAARLKLALIFLMVLALVTAPYAFDVNKGKLTKSYAVAKDGDDDDANVWPAEFWNVCPPTNNHSEGRALSRADVPLLARALRMVKDAEAHVRPDCYTTVYEQWYCEGGPFESKTRPSLRIFQRVMGRAVQYWSSPTVEWESTSRYAALVEIGSELEMPSPDDAADNADTDAIDNTTALPAWSDKVTYDKLWQYNVADLTAGGYFPIDNLT